MKLKYKNYVFFKHFLSKKNYEDDLNQLIMK